MVFVRWHYREGAYVRSHYRRLKVRQMMGQAALPHLGNSPTAERRILLQDGERARPGKSLTA
jgi:hypothetical protein